MRIGALFSGIGGLELGLELAGVGRVVWQVEIDEWCRRVLAAHWPEADRHGDIKTVGAHNLAAVDVVCGGFPCTDISIAGLGAGLGGDKSSLFFELARVVGELRPRYVVLENSPALAFRGLGDVLGALSALGYDAWWDCIPAAAVGAPHRRDRFFLVAWRVPSRDRARDSVAGHVGEEVANSRGIGLQGLGEAGPTTKIAARGGPVANPDRGGLQAERGGGALDGVGAARGGDPHRCDLPPWPRGPGEVRARGGVQDQVEPVVCRRAHGVPPGVDQRRLRAYGNAVVPAVAVVLGKVVLAMEGHR